MNPSNATSRRLWGPRFVIACALLEHHQGLLKRPVVNRGACPTDPSLRETVSATSSPMTEEKRVAQDPSQLDDLGISGVVSNRMCPRQRLGSCFVCECHRSCAMRELEDKVV